MHHEKLEQANRAVAEWQSKVWTINEAIAKAENTLAASERRRRENALAASLGDADAQKNLDEVLQDDIRAVRDLDNLRLAGPAAEAKLREAENTHRLIAAEVKQSQVNELVLKRIAEAEDVAAALTVACEALRRYLDSGAQIYALTDDLFGSRRDDVEGWNRIAKSLPSPFADLQKRQPGVFLGGGPKLADAEASHWGVTTFKKDAA
jgi:2-keto-3-deoxy-L-rhamnonate aldolase RhmA